MEQHWNFFRSNVLVVNPALGNLANPDNQAVAVQVALVERAAGRANPVNRDNLVVVAVAVLVAPVVLAVDLHLDKCGFLRSPY